MLRPTAEARRLGRLLAMGGLVGLVAGLAAVAFVFIVDLAGTLLLEAATGIKPTGHGALVASELSMPSGRRWFVLIVPAIGGALSGLLSARFAPEAMGTGTGSVIDTYHRRGGVVRRRVPWIKAVASALTIGSGGSAGVEGPVGHIAAGFGSVLGRALKVSAAERRVMLMSGFAAGIGAVFHAPMAASIFAAEVLYRELDLEHEVLVPAIISSTFAYAIFGIVHGWDPIWQIPPIRFDDALQLVPYLALAVAVAAGGRLFIGLEKLVRRRIGKAERIPLWLRPAVGGLGVGLIGLFIPQALGVGYGIAQAAIDGQVGLLTLAVFVIAKMATSTLSAGSGGSGGLFAPSLVIGAAIGGTVAAATQIVAPGLHVDPAAFAIVGMAGFFAGVINAPLSTVIMVSELAGTYRLLVPTLWVSAISWFVNRGGGLYPEQPKSRLEAPSHLADMMGAVLRRITVRQAMDPSRPPPLTVAPETPLRTLVQHFAQTAQGVFPIVDPTGRMTGVVDGRELRRVLGEVGVDELLIARDFRVPALTARPDATLREVVGRMTASGFDDVVVVDDADAERLVGILSRREIINAYHRRMLQTAPETGERPVVTAPVDAGERTDLVAALRRGDEVGIDARTREEALAAMVRMARLPAECDRDRLLRLVLDREALGSTSVGDGLAIPHPQTDDLAGLGAPLLVIGLLRRPVPWGEGGRAAPVDTVCMLIAPSGHLHLSLLGALARALSDPTLRALLRRRAGRKALLARLTQLQQRTAAPT